MGIAVKVVLYNSEDDELVLGPFSQGVVSDDNSNCIIDVATGKTITIDSGMGWKVGFNIEGKRYKQVFIHAAVSREEIIEKLTPVFRHLFPAMPSVFDNAARECAGQAADALGAIDK